MAPFSFGHTVSSDAEGTLSERPEHIQPYFYIRMGLRQRLIAFGGGDDDALARGTWPGRLAQVYLDGERVALNLHFDVGHFRFLLILLLSAPVAAFAHSALIRSTGGASLQYLDSPGRIIR